VAALHSDPDIHAFVLEISMNASTFTKLAPVPGAGTGCVAIRGIPIGTKVALYSGTLKPANYGLRSNHCLDYGDFLGHRLVIDGAPTSVGNHALGTMQMVNHSCTPNCTADHKQSMGGLDVWFLATSKNIQAGEQLTFDYKGTFWERGTPGKKRGFQVVRCRCDGRSCPNRLWRWERTTRDDSRANNAERLARWHAGPLEPVA